MAKKSAKKSAAKKSTAKKTTAKKSTAKKSAAKKTTKRQPNAAFMKPLNPSPALAAVIGDRPMPRTEVTKRLWDYIKKYKLQDANNRRMINADEKLSPIFGKKQVSMFDMTKLVGKHLK
jgi:chromatin remodeling complex protein RSC6